MSENGEGAAPESPPVLEILTKESFFARNKIRVEFVDVPELNGRILIKELTASERDLFEASLVVKSPDGKHQEMSTNDIRAKLAQRTCVDQAHKPMFTLADIAALGAMSAAAMDRIYSASMRLSGISEKDVDEMAKNSKPAPGEEPK